MRSYKYYLVTLYINIKLPVKNQAFLCSHEYVTIIEYTEWSSYEFCLFSFLKPFWACFRFGWTWIDKGFSAARILNKKGNDGPNFRWTLFPRIASGYLCMPDIFRYSPCCLLCMPGIHRTPKQSENFQKKEPFRKCTEHAECCKLQHAGQPL